MASTHLQRPAAAEEAFAAPARSISVKNGLKFDKETSHDLVWWTRVASMASYR